MARVAVEILDEAAEAVEEIMGFTGRSKTSEVICDALRVYDWVLEQQHKGNTVIVESKNPDDEGELDDMITDPEKAKKYFETKESAPFEPTVSPAQ